MGLDMYLYEARRLTDDEVREIDGKEIYSMPEASYFDPKYDKDFNSLLPFMRKVKVKVDYFDTDKIKADYGIPKHARIYRRSYGSFGIEADFCWDKNETEDSGIYDENDPDIETESESKTIKLSDAELKEKYTITKVEDRLVVVMTEVFYWRKNYDLQNKLYELCDTSIHNCGYYSVNDEMLKAINEETEREFTNETGNLYYHEWY